NLRRIAFIVSWAGVKSIAVLGVMACPFGLANSARGRVEARTRVCVAEDYGPCPCLRRLIVFLFPFSSVLCAQSTNASLSGRISDPLSVIAEAKSATINADTNFRYDRMDQPACVTFV